MKNLDHIPDAELFADLQISLTDVALMKMLTNDSYEERLRQETNIAKLIKAEMKQRFSEKQITGFLDNGYPRHVNLAKII